MAASRRGRLQRWRSCCADSLQRLVCNILFVIALAVGLCSRILGTPRVAYICYSAYKPLQCANSIVGLQFCLDARWGMFEVLGSRNLFHVGWGASMLRTISKKEPHQYWTVLELDAQTTPGIYHNLTDCHSVERIVCKYQ